MDPLGWIFVGAFLVVWFLYNVRTAHRTATLNRRDAPIPEKKNSEREESPKPRFVPKEKPRTMTKWLEDEPEAEEGYVWMKHEVDSKTGEVKF